MPQHRSAGGLPASGLPGGGLSTGGLSTGGLRVIGRLPEGHIVICCHDGEDYSFLVRTLGISVECPRCGATGRGTELAEQTYSLRRRPGYADATTITASAQKPGPDPKPGDSSALDAPGRDAPDWPPDEPRDPPQELPPDRPPHRQPDRPPDRPPADPPVPPAVLRACD